MSTSSREKWSKTTLKLLPWKFHLGLFHSRPHAGVAPEARGPASPAHPGPTAPDPYPPLFFGPPGPGAQPARISKPGAAVRVGCAPCSAKGAGAAWVYLNGTCFFACAWMAAALAVIMRHINSSTLLGGGLEWGWRTTQNCLSPLPGRSKEGGGEAEEAWSPTGERPRFLTRSLCTSLGGGGARTLSAQAFAG